MNKYIYKGIPRPRQAKQPNGRRHLACLLVYVCVGGFSFSFPPVLACPEAYFEVSREFEDEI